MTYEKEWLIEWMQSKPVDGNNENVVITAGWRLNGKDGQHNPSMYGTVTFPEPTENFIPYDELTQEIVLNWCWANGLDKENTEQIMDDTITQLLNPPSVVLPLPWINSNVDANTAANTAIV